MAPDKKHKIALVIGSGGIRSVVGIGVYQALAEAGYTPDLIVGCSAGALFGAALAEGHGAEAALGKAQKLWTAELTDVTRWSAMPALLLSRFGLFKEDFSFKDDRKIVKRINEAFGAQEIENLPIPLRITTTEATSGKSVVLDQGSLVSALRASIAIPFVFPAFKKADQLYIDGVISDPLPVSAAKDAQLVVSVGVVSPMPRHAKSPARLFNRIFAATTNNLMDAQVQLAVASGMHLVNVMPHLDRHVGLFETAAMPYLVAAGHRAMADRMKEFQSRVGLAQGKFHLYGVGELASQKIPNPTSRMVHIAPS